MILQEIRYAFRMISRSPGFTAIAALSLALGIGANGAIFSLADALILRPLPVPHESEVVTVGMDTPSSPAGGLSYPDYRDFRDSAKSFSGLVAFQLSTFSLAREKSEVPQMRAGMLVSENFFSVLGVQPALGRGFLADEGRTAGRDAVVVLSHGFWKDQFNADSSIVGRSVRINGIDFTVVGVAPAEFTGMEPIIRPAFYVPLAMTQRLTAAPQDPLEKRDAYGYTVHGRLVAGVPRSKAQAELTTLWKALEEKYPGPNRKRAVVVRTQLQARIVQDSIDSLLIGMLMALVAVVLIIACANVANLLLSRARGRTREMAVRLALGVSRTRLLRQLMIESLLLAILGAILGLGFAYGGIRFLQTIRIPSDLPIVINPQLDQRVLLFSLLAAVLSALVFGLAPAWQSLKTELVTALKNADSSSAMGRRRTLGRNSLVVAQIGLSLVLLVAAGMLLDGFRKTLAASPGFRTDHLLITEFDTSLVRYTPEQSRAFYRNLAERARTAPGVRSVALTRVVPFGQSLDDRPIVPEGFTLPKGEDSVRLLCNTVDEHYFDVMEIEILRGRGFTADDKADSPKVAVVNQEFANRFWPNQDPIGKRFHLDSNQGPLVQVVGLARNAKYTFISEPQLRYFYLPFTQDEHSQMTMLSEGFGDPAELATPVREIVKSLDVNVPVFNVRTLSNLFELRAVAPPRMIMQMVATMGLLGLTLALIGIYGLVSYSVARRTREIGVRMAIGASKSDVLKMVLRQGLALSLIGIAAGALVSAVVSRAMAAGMVGLGKPNVATFVLVPLTVLITTMAACWIPAWRASRVDPLRALRYE